MQTERQRISQKKYYRKNRKKKVEYSRKYRLDNPKYVKKYIRSVNGRWACFKASARYRKKVNDISFERFVDLIKKPCYYCGGELPRSGSGLDRQNSKIGYTLENTVPCCKLCNVRKGHLEYIGFIFPRTVELLMELIRP